MSLGHHQRTLRVPDTIDSALVQKASAEHARLLAMHRATDAELRNAKSAHASAQAQDRRDYADALAAGGEDPGTPSTDKAAHALAQIERKRSALELAIAEASAAITEAVIEDRDVLLEHAGHEVQVASTAYHEALDALAGAHATLARATATRNWLARFPEVAEPRPALLAVPGILSRNGDPEKIATILNGLRELGDVPTRPTRATAAND